MKLQEARKKSGITQTELAEALGVTQGLVSQWEAGTSIPNEHQQARMDQVLTQQVDWDQEFEALDQREQRAALQFAGYLKSEVSEDAAVRLIFNNNRYEVRRLLKGNKYLPEDHKPGDDLLLPPEIQRKRRK